MLRTKSFIFLGIVALLSPFGALYAQTDLTSVGTPSATATFESLGLILSFVGDDDQDASCTLEYRRAGDADWKTGHDLWVDHRTLRRSEREFRGSIVHLEPATTYEIRLSYTDPDGGNGTAELSATTWSEAFPEGEAVEVTDQTTPLSISESGSPDAYRVYRPAPGQTATIDVQDAHANNIVISANYVIVRGLTLVGASQNAIEIASEVHDVVIEDTDISNWGPAGIGSVNDYHFWDASAIIVREDAERIIVQNNTIHHPRGGANSWADGPEPWQTGSHPMGPQAMSFMQTAGNHVIRYNHCYSEGEDHYFNDIIGGGNNGGSGNLHRDSDVYGNIVSHAWDDGLEIEGYNINLRIWGNVIHNSMKAIATANIGYTDAWGNQDNSLGPQYIWRNLIMDAEPPSRSATKIRGNGGYYFYHNTLINNGVALEAPLLNPTTTVNDVQRVGVVKNNVILSGTFRSASDAAEGAPLWFFDYNLYAEDPTFAMNRMGVTGWETHGIFNTTPTFEQEGDYVFYLAPGEPGVDAAEFIPNFSDGFLGSAPDMGAFERGVFPPADTDGSSGEPDGGSEDGGFNELDDENNEEFDGGQEADGTVDVVGKSCGCQKSGNDFSWLAIIVAAMLLLRGLIRQEKNL
jgi:hypothetical protein